MTRRSVIALILLGTLIAVESLPAGRAAGQSPTVTAPKTISRARATTPARMGTPVRTPDGHPDLQGTWNISTLTPLERPTAQAGQERLTDQEAAALERQNAQRIAQRNAPSAPRK